MPPEAAKRNVFPYNVILEIYRMSTIHMQNKKGSLVAMNQKNINICQEKN